VEPKTYLPGHPGRLGGTPSSCSTPRPYLLARFHEARGLGDEQLLVIALVLHNVYRSFGVVLRLLLQ
jgi:hypothetical protein